MVFTRDTIAQGCWCIRVLSYVRLAQLQWGARACDAAEEKTATPWGTTARQILYWVLSGAELMCQRSRGAVAEVSKAACRIDSSFCSRLVNFQTLWEIRRFCIMFGCVGGAVWVPYGNQTTTNWVPSQLAGLFICWKYMHKSALLMRCTSLLSELCWVLFCVQEAFRTLLCTFSQHVWTELWIRYFVSTRVEVGGGRHSVEYLLAIQLELWA